MWRHTCYATGHAASARAMAGGSPSTWAPRPFSSASACGGLLTGADFVIERAIGPTTLPWHDPQPDAFWLGAVLLGYFPVVTAGGWMASRREERAPAVSALALGIAWACLALVVPLPGRATLPTWYLLGLPVAVLTGTTLGGLRRIATRRLAPARP